MRLDTQVWNRGIILTGTAAGLPPGKNSLLPVLQWTLTPLTWTPSCWFIPRQQNYSGFSFPWHFNILAFAGECLGSIQAQLSLTEKPENLRVANTWEKGGEKSGQTS